LSSSLFAFSSFITSWTLTALGVLNVGSSIWKVGCLVVKLRSLLTIPLALTRFLRFFSFGSINASFCNFSFAFKDFEINKFWRIKPRKG
jgi:hypothetical protein